MNHPIGFELCRLSPKKKARGLPARAMDASGSCVRQGSVSPSQDFVSSIGSGPGMPFFHTPRLTDPGAP